MKLINNYHYVTLIELVTLQRGHDLPKKLRKSGQYPIISSSGIIDYHHKCKSKGPGVIIGRSGKLGLSHYTENNYWPLNTTLYSKKFHDSDPKFVYYLIKTLNLENFNAGTSVPTLNRNHIHTLEIFVPTQRNKQKKIGKILYDLDTKIENLQKQNKILEQIAQVIFKSWFVDFDGRTEFVDSELGKIPKGWKISEINDVCKTFGGGTPSTTNPDYWNGRIHWLVPSDLTHSDKLFCVSSERKITDLGLKQCASQLHPESSILMTSRATIGAFAINKMPTATNQGFIVSRPNDLNHLYYLFLNFSNRIDEFVNNANGSTFLEISRGIFRELPILVPPADTLNAFHYKIKSFFEQRLNNEEMIETLTKIRDILLPKLVSGEIRV